MCECVVVQQTVTSKTNQSLMKRARIQNCKNTQLTFQTFMPVTPAFEGLTSLFCEANFDPIIATGHISEAYYYRFVDIVESMGVRRREITT